MQVRLDPQFIPGCIIQCMLCRWGWTLSLFLAVYCAGETGPSVYSWVYYIVYVLQVRLNPQFVPGCIIQCMLCSWGWTLSLFLTVSYSVCCAGEAGPSVYSWLYHTVYAVQVRLSPQFIPGCMLCRWGSPAVRIQANCHPPPQPLRLQQVLRRVCLQPGQQLNRQRWLPQPEVCAHGRHRRSRLHLGLQARASEHHSFCAYPRPPGISFRHCRACGRGAGEWFSPPPEPIHASGPRAVYQVGVFLVWYKVPGEIKRSRDLRGGRWSWTFKLAQKRSWEGRWSWAEKVGLLLLWVVQVVHQQQCNEHCLCDSVQVQQSSLGNGEGTPP